MGVAAARLVMVEGVDDEGKPLDTKPAPAGSVLMPVLGLLAITVARAAGEPGFLGNSLMPPCDSIWCFIATVSSQPCAAH